MATTLIEQCKISPPSDAAVEFSLPFTFFDMQWYQLPPPQLILFYEIPGCSRSRFVETIVPDLKHSLSLTLAHFLPLAGNIVHPLNPAGNRPVTRYMAGDSVSFTISESNADFNHLTENSPRDSNQFYAFLPHLPMQPTHHSEHNSISYPVMSLQATLFPGHGVSISYVSHHMVTDASSMASFMQAWGQICSSLNMHNNNNNDNKCLQFYDRQTLLEVNGLGSLYWDQITKRKSLPVLDALAMKFPIDRIRTTIILKRDEIQRLKDYVLARRRGPPDILISSFVAVCAFLWVCLAKSAVGEEALGDDEREYFTVMADCRGKLKPPLPANYFGNCVAPVITKLKHGELVKGDGVEGFMIAAESIAKTLQERVHGENGVLYGAERWREKFAKSLTEKIRRRCGVAGSPRIDFYGVDFGWGQPNKAEFVLIDSGSNISFSKSRYFEGGFEIGISKPKLQLEAFTAAFQHLLLITTKSRSNL